jgi:GNAT superfamily N-acetyltransferase
MWTFEEMTGILREPTSERRTVALAAHDGDRMVGAGFAMLSLLDNTDTAWVFACVEPELRGRGIGAVVMDAVVEVCRADGRTQLLGGAGIPFEERETSPVLRWAEAQGFTLANTEIQRNLHGDYEIRSFVRPIPDELLASWCELTNTFMLEAPMGDVEVEAGATTPASVRELDAVNEKIGRMPREATEAFQWGTLVHRDHRGHRLGAAVKVANLRALGAGHPDVPRVVTVNAETNAWMVAINDRLGFAPVSVVPTLKRRL